MLFPVLFNGEGTGILLKGKGNGDMEGEIQNKEKIRASIGCSVLRMDSISEDVTNMLKCLQYYRVPCCSEKIISPSWLKSVFSKHVRDTGGVPKSLLSWIL